MKKLLMTLAAVVMFAACNDDDPAWKALPTTPITGENATLTVNGNPSELGSVQLTPISGTKGNLLLMNALPGYAEINMEVTLAERQDGTGTFDIAGETGLTTPPVMVTKAETEPAIFNVSVTGYITPEGKAAITMTSVLSTGAQGGLTASWDMLKNITADDYGAMQTAPVWVTWSAKDAEQPNAEQLALTVRTLVSPLLYQFLHSLTFSADGNVTAQYRKLSEVEDFDISSEIMNCMFSGFEYDDNYNPVAIADLHPDIPWLTSPKGLLYWYVKDGYLYIVPDIAAIFAQINEDNGTAAAGSDISSLLSSLGEFGIDINKLLPLVTQWMQTGIPLKYEKTADGLKLSADKEMCGPVIEALLPALPTLDEKIAELANSEDPMMQMLPMMLPMMLGIENLSALDPIWKNNTDQFEISLHFVTK